MNTKWNFFAEIEGSSNNNYRDVATSQALGNISISFSFQNWENRENLTSQILKNFPLVQTLPMFEPIGNFSKPVFSVFLSRLRILRALSSFHVSIALFGFKTANFLTKIVRRRWIRGSKSFFLKTAEPFFIVLY